MNNKMYYKWDDIKKSYENQQPIMITKTLMVTIVKIVNNVFVARIHYVDAFRIFGSIEDFNKWVKNTWGKLL